MKYEQKSKEDIDMKILSVKTKDKRLFNLIRIVGRLPFLQAIWTQYPRGTYIINLRLESFSKEDIDI